ncbi:ATP-dependent DNA ligase [Paenibacillus doosanensis]|uniref:ATP-dependent DNA ligase n=1 Tax=Paenibacillus doosanensis TaxID=1229154 RepID=UPI00217FCC09|nr:hypothetical protein [Paenibacillus doosanensis]
MTMKLSPMLAEHADSIFNDEAYVFEPKWGGRRLILSRQGIETRLWLRDKNEATRHFPELHRVPADGDVVLDGEVCCLDPHTGRYDPKLAGDRLQAKGHQRIRAYMKQRPACYIVWDILMYKGRDLRGLPLMKRRSVLESVLKEDEYFRITEQADGRGEDLYRKSLAEQLPGIVAKRKDSPYVSRRSHDWLAIAPKPDSEGI